MAIFSDPKTGTDTGVFGDPKERGGIFDTTSTKGGIFGDSSTKDGIFGSTNKLDLQTNEGLRFLAEQEGYKKKKHLNAIQKVGRFLNFDIAAIAGGVRGAILPEETIRQGVARGIKENIGFSDVIREIVGTPETRGGKIAVGTVGFAADILFSPLTYLTFGVGAGVKIGGKALTKKASKLATTGAKELREGAVSRADTFIKEGIDPTRAKRLAESEAKRDVNELYQKIISDEGLTTKSAEKFIEKGLNTNTVESIDQLGKTLFDQGGIKFFAKTLVTSERLGRTPIGKAAKRVGQTEIVQNLKNTLGKTWVFNFGKNPEIGRIIAKASMAKRRAAVKISDATDKIFKGTSEEEQVELFQRVFDERVKVVDRAREIEEQHLTEFSKNFPGLKIKDKEGAKRVMEGLEDSTLKTVEKLRDEIDKLVKPFFEQRQALIKKGASVSGAKEGLQKTPFTKGFERVDELNKLVEGLKIQLRELRKSKKGGGNLGLKSGKEIAIELGDEELAGLRNSLIVSEEQRLEELIGTLADGLEKVKAKPVKAGVKAAKGAKGTPAELAALYEKEIKRVQNELADKSITLGKVLDAKRSAKAVMRGKRLMFPDNEKLQGISDLLFEGDSSVVAKMSQLAGLSEVDAYKFYLPSIFKDVTNLKAFSKGISSPKLNFLKEFHGTEGEKQIKNAAEALKRGRIQVTTARIKGDSIKAMFKKGGIGKPISEMSEREAQSLGYTKLSRTLIDGKFEGWVPKVVHDDIANFLEPKANHINDLAQATGFDYFTGLFKGYVTSLFPAFHFRNMTSNQFQLMLKYGVDALNPRFQKTSLSMLLSKDLTKKFTLDTGEELTYKQLFKKIEKESDFLDKGAFSDIEQLLEGVARGKSWNPLSRRWVALEYGREWGTLIENQSKLTGVLAGLSRGKGIKEAVKDAEDALFNYRNLTDFEKDIMRRVIPFYTWARKNFELQLKTLASTPGRTAAQIKFVRGIGESFGEPVSESDKEGLPSWVLDRMGIKVSNKKVGGAKFFTGLGLPIEEFLTRFSGDKGFVWNTISNTMTQMNPLIKLPFERGTEVDLFQGRPITEISNGASLKPFLEVLPGPIEKQFKELLQWKEIKQPRFVRGVEIGTRTKYTANPFALHIFRNLPTARLQQTISYKDDEERRKFEQVIRLTTGLSGFSIDKERQKFFDDLEEKRDLVDFLKRTLNLGEKEIFFLKQ